MNELTTIGITDWRNTKQPFGIKNVDRLGHIYAIGKAGVGKSTLLLNLAISNIVKGKGCCIIDPHGDMAETILNYIPQEQIDDIIYFNPKDLEYPQWGMAKYDAK
jgi:DNA helicase HerA-like ATPase